MQFFNTSVSKMKILAVLLFVGLALAKHEEYAGWKTYYVGPSDQTQLRYLRSLDAHFELDFLGQPSVHAEGVVLVKPQYQESFAKTLEDFGIKYRVQSEDVAQALRYDDVAMESWANETMARGGARIPYNNYQRYAVIDQYLRDMASRYPNRATLVTAANSFEGRPIRYLRISSTNFNDRSKPIIVIDGGMHAREWISPPTVTWAIHKLLEDVTEPDLLQRYDWILLPVANPDGYEFSHTNSRFWRKTRSTDTNSLSGICPGVDGNRNFDFFWNTVGTSNSACADTYAGNRAFSEVEVRVVRDIVNQNLARVGMYITMHSFGSMILYPWGHDGSLSNNALALHTVGIAMVNGIHTLALPNFPRYVVGNSVNVIGYAASGAAEDWAHSVGVPLSYTYELPGLSSGFEGFNLPPQHIAQVCRETWAGIVAGARRAVDLLQVRDG